MPEMKGILVAVSQFSSFISSTITLTMLFLPFFLSLVMFGFCLWKKKTNKNKNLSIIVFILRISDNFLLPDIDSKHNELIWYSILSIDTAFTCFD